MAAWATFGGTYSDPRGGSGKALTSENILLSTQQGEISRTFVMAQGAGLVDFALIPHLNNENHKDASMANVQSGLICCRYRYIQLTTKPLLK